MAAVWDVVKKHVIFSLDVKAMFPALPVKEISDYIVNTVYENPTFFFSPEELENGHVSEFPERNAFKELVESV